MGRKSEATPLALAAT
jgi:hypothetical protein